MLDQGKLSSKEFFLPNQVLFLAKFGEFAKQATLPNLQISLTDEALFQYLKMFVAMCCSTLSFVGVQFISLSFLTSV